MINFIYEVCVCVIRQQCFQLVNYYFNAVKERKAWLNICESITRKGGWQSVAGASVGYRYIPYTLWQFSYVRFEILYFRACKITCHKSVLMEIKKKKDETGKLV